MSLQYRCSKCGRGPEQGVERAKLVVKKSIFVTMGRGGKTIRSRVLDWLCPACLGDDRDWNREDNQGSFKAVTLG